MTETTTTETPVEITAVPVDSLAAAPRGELSSIERNLANAIHAVASVAGQAAQLGTVYTDRKASGKEANRIKRLMTRAGLVPAGQVTRVRTVAAEGGVRLAVLYSAKGEAPKGGRKKS